MIDCIAVEERRGEEEEREGGDERRKAVAGILQITWIRVSYINTSCEIDHVILPLLTQHQ